MARLRKLIDVNSDSDDSLPDLNKILKQTRLPKTPGKRPPITANTPRTTTSRVLSTSGLFAATHESLTKKSAPKNEIVVSEEKAAAKEERVPPKHDQPKRQRALKTIQPDDTLFNKLPIERLALEKESTPRRIRNNFIGKPVIAITRSSDGNQSGPTRPLVPTRGVADELKESSSSDSDVPIRRRRQREPRKTSPRDEPRDLETANLLVETEEIGETVEESIICGSDSEEDSFIVGSDTSESESESDQTERTNTDRKSTTRWTNTSQRSTSTKLKDSHLPSNDWKPTTSLAERPSSSSSTDQKAILRFSPSHGKTPRKVSPNIRPVTPPPQVPIKTRLVSPSKQRPRIPTPPHGRPSLDAFWDPQQVNDWHDKHSPQKPLVSPRKNFKHNLTPNLNPSTSGLDAPLSPTKSPSKKAQLATKRAFEARRQEIATSFFAELDATITSNQLRDLTAPAGGVKLIWSTKLATTAGRANWRREVLRLRTPSQAEPSTLVTKVLHHASIELSTKVIDCDTRLYNVVAHEFCHLANFMISKISHSPHGASFKAWAAKVSAAFADRGVEVTTKHSYAISYKYIWACEGCGQEYKRHSKSVDPKRHTCSVCRGRLVQIQPVPRKGALGEGGEKAMSEYQLFVKENFQAVKKECEGLGHGAVMERLGKMYRERKETKTAVPDKREDAADKLNDLLQELCIDE